MKLSAARPEKQGKNRSYAMILTKTQARMRRKQRIRKKIFGTALRPRLVVFRSNAYIYAQIIDDAVGKTLVAESSLALSKGVGPMKLNRDTAALVGRALAAKAKERQIEQVIFDRNGYLYHGRVKALADGAREGGLQF
jgi:large subunit ribosomal protein L18